MTLPALSQPLWIPLAPSPGPSRSTTPIPPRPGPSVPTPDNEETCFPARLTRNDRVPSTGNRTYDPRPVCYDPYTSHLSGRESGGHDADPEAADEATLEDLAGRARSDTLCTLSSSSSSAYSYSYLQTPPTPGILAQLELGSYSPRTADESPSAPTFDKGKGRRRLSYGFGHALQVQLEPPLATPLQNSSQQLARVSTDAVGTDDNAANCVTPILSAPAIGLPCATQPTASASLAPTQPSWSAAQPSTPNSGPTTSKPPYRRSKSSFSSAVRDHLDRSRASFRALGKAAPSTSLALESDPAADSSSGSPLRRPRLDKRHSSKIKDLFARSRSRAGSTASLSLSFASSRSDRVRPHDGQSEAGNAVADTPRSSSIVSMASLVASSVDDDPLRPTHQAYSAQTMAASISGPVSLQPAVPIQAIRTEGGVLIRDYARTDPPRPALAVRPERALSAAVVTLASHFSLLSPTDSDSVFPSMRQRAMSLPQLDNPSSSRRKKGKGRASSVDLFALLLPREVQLLVFRALVASYAPAQSHPFERSRWSGLPGAQRELVRLSRVSRAWHSLAYDPQLWPLTDLSRAGPFLHPRTVDRILRGCANGIKQLSLRGLDGLGGEGLLDALADCASYSPLSPSMIYRPHCPLLPSLTHLDLRHTALPTPVLLTLLSGAPALTHLNLGGTPTASSLLLRALPNTSTRLQSLEVSRCWDLTLGDVHTWLALLPAEQAQRVRVLKVGGLKSYGRGAGDLLRAVGARLGGLEHLSVQGCAGIQDGDFEGFAAAVRDRLAVPILSGDEHDPAVYRSPIARSTSALRYLNISSCPGISHLTFSTLTGLFPLLETLEAAALPEAFHEVSPNSSASASAAEGGEQVLCAFLQACPRLRRLDLEGTGLRAGVGDRVLACLTPPPASARLGSCCRRSGGEVGDGVEEAERYVGDELEELRVGYAKGVTPEGLQRLIAGCPKLRVLEADNTSANNAVMRAFMSAHTTDRAASLNLVDCRSITPLAYSALAPTTRPRRAVGGYEGVPFVYDAGLSPVSSNARIDRLSRPAAVPRSTSGLRPTAAHDQGSDLTDDEDDMADDDEDSDAETDCVLAGEYAPKPVLKTFWSWRRVGVPRGWKEELARAEREDKMWGCPGVADLSSSQGRRPSGPDSPGGSGGKGRGRGRARAATLGEANARAGKGAGARGAVGRARAGTEGRGRWWVRSGTGGAAGAGGIDGVEPGGAAGPMGGAEEYEPPQGGRCVIM